MQRRDHGEVLCSLLEAGVDGALKTRLVYRSNLNFQIIKSYIEDLINSKMFTTDGKLFYTTEKGKAFIQSYTKTMEMLK